MSGCETVAVRVQAASRPAIHAVRDILARSGFDEAQLDDGSLVALVRSRARKTSATSWELLLPVHPEVERACVASRQITGELNRGIEIDAPRPGAGSVSLRDASHPLVKTRKVHLLSERRQASQLSTLKSSARPPPGPARPALRPDRPSASRARCRLACVRTAAQPCWRRSSICRTMKMRRTP